MEYNARFTENVERIKKLCLMDDGFMTKCFEDNPACTELLLHIILEKPDLRVIEVHTQHVIKNLQGRSLRLDIFAVDRVGKRCNIEVQRSDEGAKAKRARYHSSLVDANVLLSGDDTENLPETYVIFITEHDVLGGNIPVYHIDRTIAETGVLFNDGAHIIYVNGEWRDDSPLGRLMHDFSCSDPADMYYSLLAERVRYFKEDLGGKKAMAGVFDEFREEITEEVTREVTREVTKKNLTASIQTLMETMHFTVEQAMDALRIPAKERADISNQLASR